MAGYLFGGNTGVSYEDLQKRRAIAQGLMQREGMRQPQYALEGLAQGAGAIVGALLDRKAEKQEGKMREDFNTEFASLFGGSAPQSAATDIPAPQSGMEAYRNAIASIESAGSGDYQAIGPTNPKLGRALGRYQIMEANIGPWSREALGREVSADEFLANPALQDAIFDHKFGGYVQQFGPEGAAQAWFAGPGGVGKMNRQDVLGTSVGDYTQKFTNALGGASGGSTAGPNVQRIAQIMAMANNPMASPAQQQVAQIMLQRELQAGDPMRALELEKAQLEIDRLRQPQQPDLPASVVEAQWRAEQAGLQPGTPEYQSFVLNGGGDPATFRALDMQARAAGLQPGTPEYQEFMATRGAGQQAYARGTGANQADIETGGAAAAAVAGGQVTGKAEAQKALDAPGAVVQADETISLIDQVINDPALPSVVGKIQGRIDPASAAGMFMSQEALNLMPKIEQLQGKAFLQAFESLKGGGQITEREGQAATAASSRLQQRYVDEATYIETLQDMRRIAENARRRAAGEDVPEYVPEWFDGGAAIQGAQGTALDAANQVRQQVGAVPNFTEMTDEELEKWIAENGG